MRWKGIEHHRRKEKDTEARAEKSLVRDRDGHKKKGAILLKFIEPIQRPMDSGHKEEKCGSVEK